MYHCCVLQNKNSGCINKFAHFINHTVCRFSETLYICIYETVCVCVCVCVYVYVFSLL